MVGGGEVTDIHRVVWEGLTEKRTFEQRPA